MVTKLVCQDCEYDAREGVEATPEELQEKWPVLYSAMWEMWLCGQCAMIRGASPKEKRKIRREVKKIKVDKWDKGIYTLDDEIILERANRPKDIA